MACFGNLLVSDGGADLRFRQRFFALEWLSTRLIVENGCAQPLSQPLQRWGHIPSLSAEEAKGSSHSCVPAPGTFGEHIGFGQNDRGHGLAWLRRHRARDEHPALARLHAGLMDAVAQHIVVVAHDEALPGVEDGALISFYIDHGARRDGAFFVSFLLACSFGFGSFAPGILRYASSRASVQARMPSVLSFIRCESR